MNLFNSYLDKLKQGNKEEWNYYYQPSFDKYTYSSFRFPHNWYLTGAVGEDGREVELAKDIGNGYTSVRRTYDGSGANPTTRYSMTFSPSFLTSTRLTGGYETSPEGSYPYYNLEQKLDDGWTAGISRKRQWNGYNTGLHLKQYLNNGDFSINYNNGPESYDVWAEYNKTF